MDNFNIESDLSITNTKLVIDGKEVTKKSKVVGISFYASSPVKDEQYSGWVDLSVTIVDDKGNAETKSYRKSEFMANKIPMGHTIKDFLDKKGTDQVVRYIGSGVDEDIKSIADAIAKHCKDSDIKCPDTEVLYNRTLTSLKDKAEDLGLTLEDSTESNADDSQEDTDES